MVVWLIHSIVGVPSIVVSSSAVPWAVEGPLVWLGVSGGDHQRLPRGWQLFFALRLVGLLLLPLLALSGILRMR